MQIEREKFKTDLLTIYVKNFEHFKVTFVSIILIEKTELSNQSFNYSIYDKKNKVPVKKKFRTMSNSSSPLYPNRDERQRQHIIVAFEEVQSETGQFQQQSQDYGQLTMEQSQYQSQQFEQVQIQGQKDQPNQEEVAQVYQEVSKGQNIQQGQYEHAPQSPKGQIQYPQGQNASQIQNVEVQGRQEDHRPHLRQHDYSGHMQWTNFSDVVTVSKRHKLRDSNSSEHSKRPDLMEDDLHEVQVLCEEMSPDDLKAMILR